MKKRVFKVWCYSEPLGWNDHSDMLDTPPFDTLLNKYKQCKKQKHYKITVEELNK